MQQSALIIRVTSAQKEEWLKALFWHTLSNNKAETGEAIWIFVKYRFCALAHFSWNKRSRFSDKTGHKNTVSHRFYRGIESKEQVKRCWQKQGEEERCQYSRWKKLTKTEQKVNASDVLKVFNVRDIIFVKSWKFEKCLAETCQVLSHSLVSLQTRNGLIWYLFCCFFNELFFRHFFILLHELCLQCC